MAQFPEIIWTMLRPLARLYWRWQRPLTMGARGIVRDSNGHVLLVKHTYVSGWYLPGGGVERSETALSALCRELDEEAGVILKERPRFVGLYANFREFKSDHVALFAVEPSDYDRVERKSFEIAETGFFAPDQLPRGTTPSTRARIHEAEEGLPAPDFW